MIKRLMACTGNNIMQRLVTRSIAMLRTQSESARVAVPRKAYQVLLGSSMENSIKFPSQEILKILRSRGITRIMAANHSLEDTSQVLEAHVECLYALIHRIEPSIEAIAMFVETIYTNLDKLRQADLSDPIFLNLLKPTVMTKFVKITQAIDSFYNQVFRSMISALVIKLLEKSNKNQVEYGIQMRKLAEEVALAKNGKLVVKDAEGNAVRVEDLAAWEEERKGEIEEKYIRLGELDYWSSFQFVLSLEYYTNSFLVNNIGRLVRALEKDHRNVALPELMAKIKSIVELHRFKNHGQVGRGLRPLFFAYNKLVDQYFKVLSHEPNLIEIISSEEPIIQAQLLTSFLSQEHHERAKKVYLEIFKAALNVSSNGVLLVDIKRLRGVFEVILMLYGHEDTKEVHELLAQLQKVMMIYPLEKFDKLEAHCFVCDKFGFRSDFFAEKLLKGLLMQKEKLQRNRGHLHHVHQVTRELNLAKKFLLFSKIANRPTKEQLQIAAKSSSQLFDPNVWYLLVESDTNAEAFFTASSFSHYIYFLRTGIQNVTVGLNERLSIAKLCSELGLHNINRQHVQLMQDMKTSNGRYSLKLDHLSNWRHNPHARMCALLELANHHHTYLRRTTPLEANNFINQFLSKTLGSTFFYSTLKQRYAYPGILQQFIILMECANPKNFPLQGRDLEAIKRFYHAQLTKSIKEGQQPPFSHYYQEGIDNIELNRAIIPFGQEVYGLSNIGNCAARGLLYQAMRRFEKQKEYLRIQIETFLKFNKTNGVQVVANYLQLPHLADLKVTSPDQCTVVLFRSYEGEHNHFINYKQVEMQREAEQYWRKKGHNVLIVKGEKDIEEFMKKITKQPIPR